MNKVVTIAGLCVCSNIIYGAINDKALENQMPGKSMEYRMPKRLYTPEMINLIRKGGVYYKLMYPAKVNRAGKWTSIPLDRWKELIVDYAPASLEGNTGNLNTCGLSPFTGKIFRAAPMSDEDFINNPFQIKEKGTDFIIYEREKDMPANYKFKPNHVEKIPHLDGTLKEYKFYVPAKYRNAGPEYGSDRKNWFCPAGIVWGARLKVIMREVIPDLTQAVIMNNDPKAVKNLAVILDRIADICPGLPLYCVAKAHGFARSPDGKSYMTAQQYRSVASKQPFINARDRKDYPFWYRDIYDFSYSKFPSAGAWTDGANSTLGWIAGAYDLIKDRPETIAYSKKKYGTADGWDKHFQKNCLKELEYLALATPPTTGNTSYDYITGALKTGIATQNKVLFSKALAVLEMYMYNNWFPDGMAGDAAYNYAGMTQSGILGLSWLNDYYGGGNKLQDIYPLKKTMDKLGYSPIGSLLGIPSKHADQHSFIFRGAGKAPKKTADRYQDFEKSQSLPFYGLTALRGGTPGKRMELIVSHQNAFQHSHLDNLGYQIFYEGIDCLPDFGYCIGYVDPKRKPWSELKTDYELIGLPNKDTDRWGPWKWGFADRPEAHNVLMVDYWLYNSIPCMITAYAGAKSMHDPGWWAQFVDVDAAGMFSQRPNPVSIYSRQLAMLTFPDGTPVVVDVFRVKGGLRHDLFMHVPADRPENIPGKAKKLKSKNYSDYNRLRVNYDKLTGKLTRNYGKGGREITDLVRYDLPADVWHSEWLIKPSRTFPKLESARKLYNNWPDVLKDVSFNVWSYASGSPEARGKMLCGRGPYPGGITRKLPTVGLKDALDFRIQTRRAYEPGLESIFASVIDARTMKQPQVIADVKIASESALKNGGGLVCRFKLKDGSTGVYASTLDGQSVNKSNVVLKGRMGALFPAASRISLVDGTEFKTDGWSVELAPSWKNMELTGFKGDLTGDEESSLLVKSAKSLPTNGSLNGQFVFISHKCNKYLQSVYTICGITKVGKDRWKISLKDNPPFILQRAAIMEIDQKDPRNMKQTFQFHLLRGEDSVKGRRIRFPRSGYETAMLKCGRSDFSIQSPPPEGKIKKGDAFVVFNIQKGDRVAILNRFACTNAGKDKLAIQTTGDAKLSLPGKFSKAVAGSKNLEIMNKNNHTTVCIPVDILDNGKGLISLFK